MIIEIAGQTIANIYDYTYALEVLKIGEPAKVVYLRNGERREAIGRISRRHRRHACGFNRHQQGRRQVLDSRNGQTGFAGEPRAVWAAFSGRGLPHDSPDTNHADRRPESGPGK